MDNVHRACSSCIHVVLKARHLSDSAFCLIDIGLPEQAVGGFPLGLGLVVEDRPSELSCVMYCIIYRILVTSC